MHKLAAAGRDGTATTHVSTTNQQDFVLTTCSGGVSLSPAQPMSLRQRVAIEVTVHVIVCWATATHVTPLYTCLLAEDHHFIAVLECHCLLLCTYVEGNPHVAPS